MRIEFDDILESRSAWIFHVPVKTGCLFPFFKSITNVIMVRIKNIDNKKTDKADTVNPFDRDVSLRPGNLYANLVLAESEQVSYYNQY